MRGIITSMIKRLYRCPDRYSSIDQIDIPSIFPMALSYRHGDYSRFCSHFLIFFVNVSSVFLLFHRFSFLCASRRQELQAVFVTRLWIILIANFSVLSETTRRNLHERAITYILSGLQMRLLIFLICKVRHPVDRRSSTLDTFR